VKESITAYNKIKVVLSHSVFTTKCGAEN